MSQYEGTLIDKISFLTAEQQERVLKFVEQVEAETSSEQFEIALHFEPFELRCRMKYQTKQQGYTVSTSDDIVQIFCRYMREHHHLLIGRPTAEKVIEEIGSLYPLTSERTFMIKGRDLDNGLPASREISSIEVREQIAPSVTYQIRQFAVNLRYLPHRMDLSDNILIGATIRLGGQ
jgi:hypothetical protein